MTEHCVALLGRRDEPTDAVKEYCQYLGRALAARGIVLELTCIPWAEKGWRRALVEFRKLALQTGNANWFLLQHTALAWSRRGFPWRVLTVIRLLKKSGARCAVIFHDSEGYGGSCLVDRLRRFVQIRVMQGLVQLADVAIVNVPPENVRWLPRGLQKAVFIPVGANLPTPEKAWSRPRTSKDLPPSVAIFSPSGGRVGKEEAETIADVASYAAQRLGALRLVVLGRNSEAGALQLKEKLSGTSVQIEVHGLLPSEEVVRVLASCDAMLFVRGPISSRRSSAIAGIACGLPVIAPEGSETAVPITEAGVVLLSAGARDEFGPALVRVLTDDAYRESLAERSRQAYLRYFSWEVIAAQYLEALRGIQSLTHKSSEDQKG